MSKLPVLKAREVISVLLKIGFRVIRSRGSHFRFEHPITKFKTTVSFHPRMDIPKKTLKSIINQAGMKVEKFLKYLKK